MNTSCRLGGIQEIMNALKHIVIIHHVHAEDETASVLCYLIAILSFLEQSNITTEEPESNKLCHHDVSQIIVEVMKKFRLNIHVQEYGCRI